MMGTEWLMMRALTSKLRSAFEGRKRWLSLLLYALLALATWSGLPTSEIAQTILGDSSGNNSSTYALIAAAALAQFRFFQTMGTNRESQKRLARLESESGGT